MKRGLSIAIVLVMAAGFAGAQQNAPDAETVIERFRNAEPDTKLRILERILEQENIAEYGELYGEAVAFAVNNADQVQSSVTYRNIAETAVAGVLDAEYNAALGDVWSLFTGISDTQLRVQLLEAVGQFASENQQIIDGLREWVQARHDAFQQGAGIDEQVMEAAVRAMGSLGVSDFFPQLLDAALLQYSGAVAGLAREELFALEGDPATLAEETLTQLDPEKMEQAVEFFLAADQLSQEQKLTIAVAALGDAVQTAAEGSATARALRQVRYASLELIVQEQPSGATDAVIAHFNRTVQEYEDGVVTTGRLVEAVDGLGAMGTEAAAQRLTEYLELLNTYTENDRSPNAQVMLSVVRNLERLGQSLAYDTLFYASMLDYPRRVRSAIDSAMDALSE